MIRTGGFIANGLYEEDTSPRFWRSNNQYSARMMDIMLFEYLIRNGLIIKGRDGRYLISDKGVMFSKPWYIRMFMAR
jgi:hypothetical protein